ncbi:MAG: NADH dehydrogenase, partial [Clostridiales bacterium]|nr:NADH dehydrogenase [Clostridiales bacterium]
MQLMLPVIVFLPMLSSVCACVLGKKGHKARDYFVIAVCAVEFILTASVFGASLMGREYVHSIPYICGMGLNLRADGFRALYIAVAALMWMGSGLLSPQYFAHYQNRTRYQFFTLMTLGATLGVFLSDDLYTTFIFFEIMSFTSYAWVAHDEQKPSLRAAQTYLAVAVIGGMVTLMGLFLLYRQFGTLQFEALHHAAEHAQNKAALYLAGGLALFGFLGKAGAFPVHIWLPKAHPVAPAPASALLSGVLTKTGVFGALAISCNLFRYDMYWGVVILLIGCVTMFLGALLGLFSVDLKRTLACSSMSQIGFILVGVGSQCMLGHHSALAAQGTVLHMLNHSLFKMVLFFSAGVVHMNLHKLNLNDIRGFGRKKPLLMVAFLIAYLGIAGIPGLSGYISKSLLHEGLLECVHEHVFPAISSLVETVFVITGGLTLAYMTKLFICLFVEKHPENQAKFDGMKKYLSPMGVPALVIPAALILLFGVLPDLFMTPIAANALPFMHAEEKLVPYFSHENLSGALKSILIGIGVYVFIVRPVLMTGKKGARSYCDRWPEKIDLENMLYRPAYRLVMRTLGAVTGVVDALMEKGILPLVRTVGALVAKVCDSITDTVVLSSA